MDITAFKNFNAFVSHFVFLSTTHRISYYYRLDNNVSIMRTNTLATALILIMTVFANLCVSYINTSIKYNRRIINRLHAVQAYTVNDSLQYHKSLYPCPIRPYPPLIYHIKTDKEFNSIHDVIKDETKLPSPLINELIAFGAIYFALPAIGVTISKPGGSPSRRFENMSRVIRLVISDAKGESQALPIGTYVRVHVNPRRYPIFYQYSEVDWLNRILPTDRTDLLFVEKPAGVPCLSTVDNGVENLESIMTKVYAAKIGKDACTLYNLGRLDACTEGVVAYALSKKAAANAHKLIADRNVKKLYRLLCYRECISDREGIDNDISAILPIDTSILHCYNRLRKQHEFSKPTLLKQYSQKLMDAEAEKLESNMHEGSHWQKAELIVRKVTLLTDKNLNMDDINRENSHSNGSDSSGNSSKRMYYECEVELITGRTHQIRLQFAALNLPIVGDSRYIPGK